MNKIAKLIDEATAELKASNDRAEMRDRLYPNIDWAAKNASLRAEMRHGQDREVMTSHTDQVGMIVGNFIKNYNVC